MKLRVTWKTCVWLGNPLLEAHYVCFPCRLLLFKYCLESPPLTVKPGHGFCADNTAAYSSTRQRTCNISWTLVQLSMCQAVGEVAESICLERSPWQSQNHNAGVWSLTGLSSLRDFVLPTVLPLLNHGPWKSHGVTAEGSDVASRRAWVIFRLFSRWLPWPKTANFVWSPPWHEKADSGRSEILVTWWLQNILLDTTWGKRTNLSAHPLPGTVCLCVLLGPRKTQRE